MTARPLRLLILGGTGFIGKNVVQSALSRGYDVTVFNRGTTKPPAGVEQLQGDRDAGRLDALHGRTWDAVIDMPARLPRWVRDTADLLKDAVEQYVFVSTVSVYSDLSIVGLDEDGPTKTLDDPRVETVTDATYGGLKVLAEQELQRTFADRATIVRPGLVVGPGDETDRFTYWVARIARGGEALAPGSPTDRVQFIDARDLADFLVTLVARKTFGLFNALGPAHPLRMAEMLYGIKAVTTAGAQFTWVPAPFLASQKVHAWSDLPAWIPPVEGYEGIGTLSNARGAAAGLTFRTLADTAQATLEWHLSRDAARRDALRAGLSAEREKEVLAAWKESLR